MVSPMGKVNEMMSKNLTNYLKNYQAWGKVMCNVAAYDIFGDGITDVTDKLQALINLAISDKIRSIFFPPGEYYVTSLTNADQVDFFGDNASFVGGYTGVIAQLGNWPSREQLADTGQNLDGRSINMRYPPPPLVGAKADGSDDSAAFQAIINWAVNNKYAVTIPEGVYKLQSKISIDGDFSIKGSSRPGVILDCDVGSDTVFAIAKNARVVNSYLGHFTMIGRMSGDTAIDLGSTADTPFVDGILQHIRIYNFSVGIKTTYAYCNTYIELRCQNCERPAQFGSQTNASQFIGCSFVSYTLPITLTNCEGLSFASCNISNMTDPNAPMITLFQSTLNLDNPYFENVGVEIVRVGAVNENAMIRSSVVLNGGLITGSIGLNNSDCTVIINGSRVYENFYIRNSSAQTPRFFTKNLVVNLRGANYHNSSTAPLLDYLGNRIPTFAQAYGGGGVTNQLAKGYGIINQTVNGNGIQIYNNLIIDQQYTLVYAARKGSNFNSGELRIDGFTTQVMPLQEAGEDFELRYIPFVSSGTILRLLFTGNLEIKMLRLYKGVVNTDIKIPVFTRYASNAIPTISTWTNGDVVDNTMPTAGGYASWVCTVTGSPGVFKGVGQIQT